MSVVLVTGAAGFIGTATVKHLLEQGHDVIGIDALTNYYDVSLKRANIASIQGDRFRLVEEDLLESDLTSLLSGVDCVLHLAGQPGVRGSWGEQFDLYASRNILATQRLLEAAKAVGTVQKIVYSSSSSIYGNALQHPTLEDTTPRPVSPYGVSKLAAEHLCGLYASNHGLPTTSLRYFTVYGPGQRPDMAFTRFVRAALTGGEIPLYGTGEQIRDFTFVQDIVRANVMALFQPTEAGAIFNVAGGSNVSMNEVLDLISDLTEQPLNIRRSDAVAGDVFRTGGSTHAIEEALGWRPETDLENGLRQQVAWAAAG